MTSGSGARPRAPSWRHWAGVSAGVGEKVWAIEAHDSGKAEAGELRLRNLRGPKGESQMPVSGKEEEITAFIIWRGLKIETKAPNLILLNGE